MWLNYRRLAECYLKRNQELVGVYYFTALAHWLGAPALRHQILISALKAEGVEIVLGRFKEKDRHCRLCNGKYKGHEEKETDVNIAIYLVRGAYKNEFDTAIVATNDTDLTPAIRMVKRDTPALKVGVLFPLNHWSAELEQATDFICRIKEKQLASSQFPDPYILPNGKALSKPSNWI